MIDYLYVSTPSVDCGEEERRFRVLEDCASAHWSERERWMAQMVECVGLATCLWCDARTVLGMMSKLWGCPVAP